MQTHQTQRQIRVGELVRHALAQVLAQGKIHDPDIENATITVTEVRMSPDLRLAKAYVFPLGGDNKKATLAGLNRCRRYLRGQVSGLVKLKFSPDISFEIDRSFDDASHIDQLLSQPRVMRDLAKKD